MKYIDILRIAFGNLKRNRLRTLLTVSGVVVGVGAIVFLVSLGFGLQVLALEKIVKLDALKVITVTPGSKNDLILDKDSTEKFKKIESVEAVSSIIRNVASVNIGGVENEQIVYGINPEFLDLENIKILNGKPLSGPTNNETIVSKEIVSGLGLKEEDVLGKNLIYHLDGANGKNNKEFKVVGIIDEKGIYLPFDIIKNDNKDIYASVKVKVRDKTAVPEVKKTIESMGFNTSVLKDQSKSINQIFSIINIVLGGFGMIAFFVAAIGIFNTMTISLLERTHEIGVMKAIGGNNGNIAMIFITESALIGFLGGVFGLASGWVGGLLLTLLVNFMATQSGGESVSLFSIPLSFAIATIVFSFLISTIAGIWPARRAAKLNPLEALRYE